MSPLERMGRYSKGENRARESQDQLIDKNKNKTPEKRRKDDAGTEGKAVPFRDSKRKKTLKGCGISASSGGNRKLPRTGGMSLNFWRKPGRIDSRGAGEKKENDREEKREKEPGPMKG